MLLLTIKIIYAVKEAFQPEKYYVLKQPIAGKPDFTEVYLPEYRVNAPFSNTG